MKAPVVLVTARMFGRLGDTAIRRLEDAGCELWLAVGRARPLLEDDVRRLLDGVVAVIAGIEPWTDGLMAQARDLRLICRFGVGYDSVDLDAATRRRILVAVTPSANQTGVAEFTVALIPAVTRRVASQDAGVKRGEWGPDPGPELRGRTLGIVGLGAIGRVVADLARAFGMRVVACELAPDPAFMSSRNIKLMDLDTMLAESDVVSLHVPLTPQTRKLINAAALAKMRPGAYLINTARGALVDEDALYDALATGHLAGAGLDVADPEPPRDRRLAGLSHVVMTPHMAGLSTDSIARMDASAVDTTLAVLQGKCPATILNPEVARSAGREG